jgi:hypothetical protein
MQGGERNATLPPMTATDATYTSFIHTYFIIIPHPIKTVIITDFPYIIP